MARRIMVATVFALAVSSRAFAADQLVGPMLVDIDAPVTIACTVKNEAELAQLIQVSLIDAGPPPLVLENKPFCDVAPNAVLNLAFHSSEKKRRAVRCFARGDKDLKARLELRLLADGKVIKTMEGRKPRIGLGLSGGGFRAAAFHLGVMRKLDELGILDNVDLISSVSGGSIAAAVVVLNWREANRLDVLDLYLRTKSVAVSSFLRGFFNPFRSRIEALARTYDRDLFHGAPLAALQCDCPTAKADWPTCCNGGPSPKLYLNATDLGTGTLFSFISRDPVSGARPRMGTYKLGYLTGGKRGTRKAAEFSISKAVAASSSFPPVFNPLELKHDWYNPRERVKPRRKGQQGAKKTRAAPKPPKVRKCPSPAPLVIVSSYSSREQEQPQMEELAREQKEPQEEEFESKVDYVSLTDGGVYDNMGLNPLVRKSECLDYVIVSDGGMPSGFLRAPALSGFGALRKGVSVWTQQIRRRGFDQLADRRRGGETPIPIWFSIDSTPSSKPKAPKNKDAPSEAEKAAANRYDAEEALAERASKVDTHLKALSNVEMAMLSGHGADLVEARLRRDAPELIRQ